MRLPARASAMYRQWLPTSPSGPPSSSGREQRQLDLSSFVPPYRNSMCSTMSFTAPISPARSSSTARTL